MQDSNHSGYTNFDGSPDLAPDAETDFRQSYGFSSSLASLDLSGIEPERWLHLASGIILAFGGLARRGPVGLLMNALGAGLLYQGITGVNPLSRLIGVRQDMQSRVPEVNIPDPDEAYR